MKIRYLIYIVIALLLPYNTFSQNTIKNQIYQAFIRNDLKLWKSSIKTFEKTVNFKNTKELLTLINYYYGYTADLIMADEDDQAEDCIDKAENYIERLLKIAPQNAEAINYKGAFMSYQIALSKLKAITLGKSSSKHIHKAYKLSPNNVQILFDKGNALFYPPKIFGGNKKEALKYFQKAIAILEKNKNTEQNWVYMKLLLLEARCYEEIDQAIKAKKLYQKILKIEPNFKIVKEKYYPELLEDM